MRNNRLRTLAAGCFALILILSSVRLILPVCAADTVRDAAQEILDAKRGGQSLQAWLDSELTDDAGKGAAEWYVMALHAAGERLDFSGYKRALEQQLDAGGTFSATAKQRCALALIAASGGAIPARCETLLRESLGKQGVMSQVFGLHLINQGVRCETDSGEVVQQLLEVQLASGGWTLMGEYGDPDVTAMTLQALAPYRQQPAVGKAVSRALDWLSGKQLASGGFSSYGNENPESAAQVWIALAALDISPLTDKRFVKNGHTLWDAIRQFSLGNGQYAHLKDGAANPAATQQVFLALTAEQCRQAGRYFYLPDGFRAKTEPAVTSQTTVRSSNAATESKTVTSAQTGVSITDASSAAGTKQSVQTDENVTQTDPQTAFSNGETAASAVETAQTVSTETTAQSAAHTGAVSEQITPEQTEKAGAKYPYRIPLTAGIGVVFLGACAVFWMRGNRSAKTYLTAAFLCGALTAGVWLIRIERTDDYYQPQARGGGGSVTMEIRCDVILGLEGSERFPADGIILPETAFAIDENENALTLLYDAVRANSLQIEVDGVSGDIVETAYVRGIASLYEFDFGDLSGWTYLVNGERPSVGCGAYTLHDGDQVVWAYTISL